MRRPVNADGAVGIESGRNVGDYVEAGDTIGIENSTVDRSLTAPKVGELKDIEINGNVEATDGTVSGQSAVDHDLLDLVDFPCGYDVTTDERPGSYR